MHNNIKKLQYSRYCLICLSTHFMNDFDRKMSDNDRWFQCSTSLRWWNIKQLFGEGGGGDRQIQCSMCGRVYKKLPIVNIFSSIYAIINVSMSHTHPSCFVSKVTCCLSDWQPMCWALRKITLSTLY